VFKRIDLPAIDTNGVTLTYETQGNPADPPLLLIMGLGMQLTSWPDSFCRALVERGFYLIRFDNRDSGLSTKLQQFGTPNLKIAYVKSMLRLPVASGYTLHDMARDTVGLLDGLGIEKAHIVGASMGGMIAQIIAAEYPERTLSLTSIMSTSGRRSLPGPNSEVRDAMFSRVRNPNDLNQVVNHSVKFLQLIGSPRYPEPAALLAERVLASIRRSASPDGVARQLLAVIASGDRIALLKKIRVPALVIHGNADPLVPIACGRDTARLIPGATLREIDGMGHNLPRQLDKTLADMIDAHCRGIQVPEAGLA
jgi:pimeloyl-ACP methyl ester carboxylesterase